MEYMREGHSAREAALRFNLPSIGTAKDWLMRYDAGGVDALGAWRDEYMEDRRRERDERDKDARIAELERRLRRAELEVKFLKRLRASARGDVGRGGGRS